MPYIWLEPDELEALRVVIRRRLGSEQPLDWDAYHRGMARLAAGPAEHVPSGAPLHDATPAGDGNGGVRDRAVTRAGRRRPAVR